MRIISIGRAALTTLVVAIATGCATQREEVKPLPPGEVIALIGECTSAGLPYQLYRDGERVYVVSCVAGH